ncbi:MAG: hypothetical protein J6T24_09700, partial [Clostridia bacterium]|nr:hypothetical protein [Clostridia bacterium]
MKRRILSLVLLVATVLTALPLTVLPAIAVEAEKPTYTEEDYNALYVQDGLVLAADFYRTNAYWGKEALANVKDYIWHAWQNSNGTKVTISAGGTVEDGAMTLPDTGDIVLSNVATATNKGYNGATMEQVLDINTATMSGGEGFLFNDLRFAISVNKQENKISVNRIGLRDATNGRIAEGLAVDIGCGGVTTLAFIEDRPTDTFTNYSFAYPDDVVRATDAQMEGVGVGAHYFYVTHTLDKDGIPVPMTKASAVVYALNEPVYTPE